MGANDQKRKAFFEILFGQSTGYLCIATREVRTGRFEEHYFAYPDAVGGALDVIRKTAMTHDVYYCPHLLITDKRVKENVQEAPAAWADLDTCPVDVLLIPPSVITETSEGKTQGLWLFEEPVNSADAEDISKRIAYHHAEDGCDRSGWDLTQLLRVPLTYNHKYTRSQGSALPVEVLKARPEERHTLETFNVYEKVEDNDHVDIPFDEANFPDKDADAIIDEYRVHLNPRALQLYETEPTTDWSRALWEMELSMFESGMSREEVFIVAKVAACNKYARDKRKDSFLWKEIVRAWQFVEDRNSPVSVAEKHRLQKESPLLSDEERRAIAERPDIVQEYVDWAKTLGDAAWQYHQAGAFITLSTLLTGAVRLPTSFGVMLPNMWFMILADTTLTRKSTAMDIAMDLCLDIDPDCVLATDGSLEGLMTSLSLRPGRPSVFLRDEVTGLMESLTKKDYYAGMMETLTKLYDGKYQKRVLRREVLEVKDPVLIFFAGGIKEKMLSLLNHEHVASGFLPRFIFVSAESDITKLKPLGPPSIDTTGARDELMDKLRTMREHYWTGGHGDTGKGIYLPQTWDATLTDDAWVRYNKAEADMLQAALYSPIKQYLTPTFDRLAKSGLKAATLLAAARQREDKVVVEEEDIVRAFYYVEQWQNNTVDIINNIGRGAQERMLEKVFKTIESNPGILRSTVMQYYHLTARDADSTFGTLEQRGLVKRQRSGRTEQLFPLKV